MVSPPQTRFDTEAKGKLYLFIYLLQFDGIQTNKQNKTKEKQASREDDLLKSPYTTDNLK